MIEATEVEFDRRGSVRTVDGQVANLHRRGDPRHLGVPVVRSVGTAVPEHVLLQRDAREFVRELFGSTLGADVDRLVGVFDNAGIERRHFCVPIEWFSRHHSFTEKNQQYVTSGIELADRAIDACLEDADIGREDVDYLLFVSTTGLSTPSIDARLIARGGFRQDVRRLPIWGLGCAGGASALARAMEICRARPQARVLAVVVELCGLTFMRKDLTKEALIATSLFGDGAAAVLIEGGDIVGRHHDGACRPRLLDSSTTTLPDSLEVMGWRITDDGFSVMISRDIPTIVRSFMKRSIDCFLSHHGLDLYDVRYHITHPGGAKVIQAYRESLELPDDALRHTEAVLRQFGNTSASSVLFVLQRFINELHDPERQPAYGLLGALGPGFSAELVLMQM